MPKKLIEMLSNPAAYQSEEEEDYVDDAEEDLAEIEGDAGVETVEEEEKKELEDWEKFDDLVESWLDVPEKGERGGPQKRSTPQPKLFDGQETSDDPVSQVLCARCYSLTHYGKVKSAAAESSLPGFDFGRIIGGRIALQKFRRSVVLMVVDLGDFDGSLPRSAIRSLLPTSARGGDVSSNFPSTFRLIVAANKADLVPSKATYLRLESWVRRRMSQGGLPRPSSVHIVSSTSGAGVKALLANVQTAVGSRGDVWVVGAQNAGKSSLLNAMRAAVGLKRENKVTVAPVPGTTLGLIPVPSLLPQGCKMMDTPGVPHAYQLASSMTAEEMKMLLPKRPLKPRTFRLGIGQSVAIGGVARVDVVSCPGATMYLTVWVSDEVVCHMGKTEGADERYLKHAGVKLSPPVGSEERMESFPALKATEAVAQGDSWKESSVDVAIAGLGWVAVGVGGEAKLNVWAPPGVAITTREAMLPDFARELERPGFGRVIEAGAGAAAAAGGKVKGRKNIKKGGAKKVSTN